MKQLLLDTAAVRTQRKSRVDDLRDIDSMETALLAIETINDVNAELRRHIDPFSAVATHFQSSDADKIDKFFNLMQPKDELGRFFMIRNWI